MTVGELILTMLDHPVDAEVVVTSNSSEYFPSVLRTVAPPFSAEDKEGYELDPGKQYIVLITSKYSSL